MDPLCILNDGIYYCDFSDKYLDDIIKIAVSRFGENYISREDFLKYLNKSEPMCTVALDKSTGEVLGYCMFHNEDIDTASKDFKISKEDLTRFTGSNEDICHAKSIALKKECSRRGVGYNLFKRTTDRAKELGYQIAWCPAWKRDNIVPLENVLLKNGFTYFRTVSDMWKDSKGYKCIVCNGPCRCDADVYYKVLNEHKGICHDKKSNVADKKNRILNSSSYINIENLESVGGGAWVPEYYRTDDQGNAIYTVMGNEGEGALNGLFTLQEAKQKCNLLNKIERSKF